MTVQSLADRIAALEEHITSPDGNGVCRDDVLRASVADHTNRLAVTLATIDARLRDLEQAVTTIEQHRGLPSPDFGVVNVTFGSSADDQGGR